MNTIKAFLHIGTHKTGSTAIQNFCRKNMSSIGRQGFFWIESPPIRSKLIDDYENRNFSVRFLDENSKILLELVLRKHKILLLSDEGFSSRPDTGYKYSNFLAKSLKYFLREFDVKVLVYLRRQDSFYESWYTQRIQAGTTSSDFHQFWRDFSFQNINYLKVINAYADASWKK